MDRPSERLFAPPGAPRRVRPRALSATALVSYARCPRQCYWSVVEPLPRTANAAALVGSELHRWIERLARRQPTLFDDPRGGHTSGDVDARMARLQAAFLASPYASLEPRMVEQPFAFGLGPLVVRGRVDAVYERGGVIELVDFKTGRAALEGDPGAQVQLDVYALAAVDVWRFDPNHLRTTYCYLDRGELVTRDHDDASVARVRAAIAEHVEQFACGDFRPQPGSWCRRCDFAPTCRDAQT